MKSLSLWLVQSFGWMVLFSGWIWEASKCLLNVFFKPLFLIFPCFASQEEREGPVGAAPGSISGCPLSRMSFVTQGFISSTDTGSQLAEIYGWEVVLSSEDCNAFSCLGYMTSYSVIIKYRLFSGLRGRISADLEQGCEVCRAWAARDKEVCEGKGWVSRCQNGLVVSF